MTNVFKMTPRRHGAVEHPALDLIKIRVVAERLTDGSYVHDVHLGNLVLHAVSHHDAYTLADKIAHAIDDYTVDAAEVIGG